MKLTHTRFARYHIGISHPGRPAQNRKTRRDASAYESFKAEISEAYFSAFLSNFFWRQYLSSGLISEISIPGLTRNLQLSNSWCWSSSASLPVTRQYWQSWFQQKRP